MKILLVSTSSGSRGGGEHYLLYLGTALAECGHEPTLWVARHPRMDELADRFAAIGRVIRADYTNTYDRRARSLAGWLDSATATRVAADWRALGPDVIHVNKQNLEDGLDLLAAARHTGLPCVSMIHITQSARYLRAALAGVRDWVARRALRQFPGCFVTTPENRQRELANFIGTPDRVWMIPNGVPGSSISPVAPCHAGGQTGGAGHCGNRIAGGGRGLGFRAARSDRSFFCGTPPPRRVRQPKTRFVWVGDGDLRDAWDHEVAAPRSRRQPCNAWAAQETASRPSSLLRTCFCTLRNLRDSRLRCSKRWPQRSPARSCRTSVQNCPS